MATKVVVADPVGGVRALRVSQVHRSNHETAARRGRLLITAVDTSVLLDVLHADRTYGRHSADGLREAIATGSVVACDVVWAETTAAVGKAGVDEALLELGVRFEPIDQAAATAAGSAWGVYRARGGRRSRIAADFLIGAHATATADRLLTRDRGFLRAYFRGLAAVEP